MRKHYDELHDTLSLERTLGEPEIPGMELFGAVVQVPGRKQEEVIAFTEDIVSDITFILPKQYEPEVGDRINGAVVIKKAVVKDVRSKVHRWVAYAKA